MVSIPAMFVPSRNYVIAIGSLILCLHAPASVGALGGTYPEKPIRFVVPYVPGGGADIVARTMAQKLAERFGVPVIVDNRAGAGGNLGTELVARSSPDGYTLLLGNVGPLSINPSLYKKLPYDVMTDFAPVSLLVIYPNVLVVHPSLPAKNLAEFITFAKSRPGKLAYASAGTGSSTHLAAELLKSLAGIDMLHVPYKGGAQAIVDVMAGQVQMYFSSISAALSAPCRTSKAASCAHLALPARSAPAPCPRCRPSRNLVFLATKQ